MIPLEEARSRVLERVRPLDPETVPCVEAVGGWLRSAVTSDVDQPPCDVSAMDGYAVRCDDVAPAPVELQVIGEIRAGAMPDFSLGPGQAAAIMTGAPLPAGAEAVQMVENTEADAAAGRVRILEPVEPGAHIRRQGENLRRGREVLPAGQRIGAVEVGLLAGAGLARVSVGRRPRVAVVPTGDELVEPGTRPGPGQIRNSNGSMLCAQVAAEGGVPHYLGIARDNEESLDQRVGQGLGGEMLLLGGGVSKGAYDLVTGSLRRAGVEIVFSQVAVKPGKPTVFGFRDGPAGRALVFGLPGNPVSALVMFRLLVAPALRALQGAPRHPEREVVARLEEPMRATSGREAFRPARIDWTDAGYVACPVSHRGSGDLVAWRHANGLIHLPADRGAEAGETVPVLLDPDHDRC
jgi:molybdopterin molybdotransferase